VGLFDARRYRTYRKEKVSKKVTNTCNLFFGLNVLNQASSSAVAANATFLCTLRRAGASSATEEAEKKGSLHEFS
jgi:hypothetical protein